jgi:hypothetical protein
MTYDLILFTRCVIMLRSIVLGAPDTPRMHAGVVVRPAHHRRSKCVQLV